MPDKAKVYYYKGTGRANQIRLALAAAGIPFENVHPNGFPPSPEDKALYLKLGGNTTTNIPMLEMPDGRVYTQSQAVLRAVGRMGNLLPKDDDGLYRVDKLLEDASNLREESYDSMVMFGAPQAKADKYVDVVMPKHIANLERQLKDSGGDFFLGDALTLADVAVYDAVVNFGTNRHPPALDDFPALQAWRAKVEEHEGIKEYLESDEYMGLMKFGPESLGR